MARTNPLPLATSPFASKGLGRKQYASNHRRLLLWMRNVFVFGAGIAIYVASQSLVEQQALQVPYFSEFEAYGSPGRMVLEGSVGDEPPIIDGAQTAAICAIQKNEGKYLDEWVDFHLALGFTHIYLFDNAENHDPLVKWQKAKGDSRIRIKHIPGDKQQMIAYRSCAKHAVHMNNTFLTFIDIDEFFVLKKHNNIIDFANDHAMKGGVAINWAILGTAGRATYEDAPVTARFPCVINSRRKRHYKSLVRVQDIPDDLGEFRSPHMVPLKKGAILQDTIGRPIRKPMHHGYRDVAEIYHFMYRSVQEHVEKRTRGDVFYGSSIDLNLSLQQAKHGLDPGTGKPLEEGEIFDDTPYQKLKELVPAYKDLKLKIVPPSCSKAPVRDVEYENLYDEQAVACVLSRDDPYYLMNEWHDYHMALGFTKVYVYDASPSKARMKAWADMRNRLDHLYIEVQPIANSKNARHEANVQCIRDAQKKKHSYVMLADFNSFLVLKQHENIREFARLHVQQGQTGVYWNEFGTAGNTYYERFPVVKRNPCRMKGLSRNFTSIVRVNDLDDPELAVSGERVQTRKGTTLVDTNSNRIKLNGNKDGPRDVAVMHHYGYLSDEEYGRKHRGEDIPDSLPTGTIFDDAAWQILKANEGRYKVYDERIEEQTPSCLKDPIQVDQWYF